MGRKEDLDTYAPETMLQMAERRAQWLGIPVGDVMRQLIDQDPGVASATPGRRFERRPIGETALHDIDRAA